MDILSCSFEKYTTYRPCITIILIQDKTEHWILEGGGAWITHLICTNKRDMKLTTSFQQLWSDISLLIKSVVAPRDKAVFPSISVRDEQKYSY